MQTTQIQPQYTLELVKPSYDGKPLDVLTASPSFENWNIAHISRSGGNDYYLFICDAPDKDAMLRAATGGFSLNGVPLTTGFTAGGETFSGITDITKEQLLDAISSLYSIANSVAIGAMYDYEASTQSGLSMYAQTGDFGNSSEQHYTVVTTDGDKYFSIMRRSDTLDKNFHDEPDLVYSVENPFVVVKKIDITDASLVIDGHVVISEMKLPNLFDLSIDSLLSVPSRLPAGSIDEHLLIIKKL